MRSKELGVRASTQVNFGRFLDIGSAPRVSYFRSGYRLSKARFLMSSSPLWNSLIEKRDKSFKSAWKEESQLFLRQILRILGLGLNAEVNIRGSKSGVMLIGVGSPGSDDRMIFDLGSGQQQMILLALELAAKVEESRADDSGRTARRIVKKRGKVSLDAELSEWDTPRLFYVIEEPESNLHPDAQSEVISALIDFLSAVREEVGLIIETHSVYVVRQLQIEVKRKRLHSSRVVLHYFDDVDGAVSVDRIGVRESGGLEKGKAFGKGFYDETARLSSLLRFG